MKPIPPGFCYAADNAVIPGRPWYPGAGVTTRPGFDRFGGAGAATVEDAERIDREYPLPHPGYRVGQVWLHPKYGALSVLCVDEDGVPMAYIGVTQASTNGDGILTIWGPDVYRLCRWDCSVYEIGLAWRDAAGRPVNECDMRQPVGRLLLPAPRPARCPSPSPRASTDPRP